MNKEKFFLLIFGKSGFGKSYFLEIILRLRWMKRFILIDTQDEHENIDNVDVVHTYEELIAYIDARRGTWETAEMRIVYKGLTAESMEENEAKISSILRLAMRLGNGMTVIAEECNFLMKPGDERMISKELNLLISVGRHYCTNFIGITQRPASVNVKVRSQADAIFCFNVDERADVKYITDRQSVREIEPVSPAMLPRYKCLVLGSDLGRELDRLPAEILNEYVVNLPAPAAADPL
jgi:DNA helicase HerA-like ATPase